MTHFGELITILAGIVTILVAILGFLIRGVASFTKLVTEVESLKESTKYLTESMTKAIVDIAIAGNTDSDLEKRIENLETSRRR